MAQNRKTVSLDDDRQATVNESARITARAVAARRAVLLRDLVTQLL
jgi:hypothetical protein